MKIVHIRDTFAEIELFKVCLELLRDIFHENRDSLLRGQNENFKQ